MAERITASHRVRRILAIVPWIAERDGPSFDEITERFAISRDDLAADLDVVFMVGLPPYTPDTLIDVIIEDDRVWIRLGDYFRRPLRLTPAEGLALLAAGDATATGSDTDDPLARGLAKLAAALGVQLGAEGQLDVSLGTAPASLLSELRTAVAGHRLVQLHYYSYARDEHGTRVVEPSRLTAKDGAWYLIAWCHQALDERVFRLDRVASARVLDQTFTPRDDVSVDAGFLAADTDLRVRLHFEPEARWVLEHHLVTDIVADSAGGATVTMPVRELPWLVRLLLRLGPDAQVLSVEGAVPDGANSVESVRAAVRDAAARIAARYRD